MANPDFSGINTGEATGFSTFGGHPLTQVLNEARRTTAFAAADDDGVDGVFRTLSSFGIEDAEQLIGIAAQPEARERLQSALGIKDRKFAALLKQSRDLLPKARLAQVDEPTTTEFGCGVLPPTPEILEAAEQSASGSAKDKDIESSFAMTVLPDYVNLIPFLPPIRNQGGRSTCVAFVLTALNEYVLFRHNIVRDLSEQHLYYETKQIDAAATQCGTWQTRAVPVLQNRGQAREQIWAYNPNLPCNNHGLLPPQARLDGANHRLQAIRVPPRDVATCKSHIASQRLVTLSFPVYNSWRQCPETRRSGRITMPIGSEPVTELHAVCLVGYQDDPAVIGGGFFIVRNSWSTVWGAECPYGAGYGTIPYQYIANYALESFTAAILTVGGEDVQLNSGKITGEDSVVIEVGSNIKITISSK